MSHGSQDGYQRLRDYTELEDSLHLSNHGLPPPHSTSSSPGRSSLPGILGGIPPVRPIAPPSSTTGSSIATATGASRHAGRSKKKGRRMAWLLIHNTGDLQTVHMDKRQLVQVMGLEIPMRDLRLMDPALAAWESFAQILVRDNALVVSAEYVRIIITCDKVIFPLDFEKTEQSERFMKTVESIIKERPDCIGSHAARAIPSPALGQSLAGIVDSGSPHGSRMHRQSMQQSYFKDPELLPFELNMLEVALGEITRHYAQQTANLEALAHPALDALMRNCNSTNLERVRKIKTSHQRLQGRLQGLREVMERYMEDDQDMYRMCLSKWREQDLEGAGSDNTMLLGRPGQSSLLAQSSLPRRSVPSMPRSPPGFMERFQGLSRSMRDRGDDSSSSSSASGASFHDLLEVENLLESYFMMVDGTLAKLSGVGEYIDDTEDYINIELDYNRNRLLRIEILLTVATFALAIYNLVAGILGENLQLPAAWTEDMRGFIIINVTTLSVCVVTFLWMWRVMARKKLI